MRNVIAGTAGHIDHGKTALVKALTGIDTDRLAEEKRRGISIELGFAHLRLGGDLLVGFVDVPGHERFVKNMLAGAGGIDFVLFVIAADESIKPQTREHFDICRLLGVQRGVVALTKADLVDAEILDLARLEAEEFVRGSFLEGAPMVAVSSATGAGLEELRERLREAAAGVASKESSRHFRLPVDRAFSIHGFGSVVTGTLISGAVKVEQEVEAHPGGARFRVRGIQVHGDSAVEALAGQRTALNLAGTGASELARGMTLTHPGLFRATQTVDCRFQLLASAKPLKHRAPVHFHAGAAEVVAEARLLESGEAVEPGGEALVRFLLREPALLLPGDRFIVRMFSPVTTIGGGVALDIDPPVGLRRAEAGARLKTLSEGTAEDQAALFVREAPFGLGETALVARTGLLSREVAALSRSKRFVAVEEPQRWLIDARRFEELAARIRGVLKEFHRSNPLLPGISKEQLRSQELAGAPPFLLDALIRAARDIAADGETVRLASHRVTFKQDEEEALGRIEAAFERAGLQVPATTAVLAAAGVEAARARTLLQILLRDRRLIRVGEDLVFHPSAIASVKGLLAGRKGRRFTVPEFKDWTGVSRKYAIPLLEYLDREKVTRREGDARVVA
ncbi:MAG: selenocysteine-specific translation elongation factor [Bryobacteraceae bacterium]|nr:selenocysteine-specific translation elongation factor [Bryobacteraceae bacterium]